MSGKTAESLLGMRPQGVGRAENAPEAISILALELVGEWCSLVALNDPADDGPDLEVRVTLLVNLN